MPFVYGIKDILNFIHVQYHNCSGQLAPVGKEYNAATPDFVVACTDMLLGGFTLGSGAGQFLCGTTNLCENVSVEKRENYMGLNMYPNPTNEELYLVSGRKSFHPSIRWFFVEKFLVKVFQKRL